MRLSVEHLTEDTYDHAPKIVPEGTIYGFWRVVEHTGAGWFPWPGIYTTREAAEKAMGRARVGPADPPVPAPACWPARKRTRRMP